MINSHDFKEKMDDEFITKSKEKLKIEIERKNKEDEIEFLKDLGALTQFDNFTYKTISIEKKNHNYSSYIRTENELRRSLKN